MAGGASGLWARHSRVSAFTIQGSRVCRLKFVQTLQSSLDATC